MSDSFDLMHFSLLGSSVHGILQARILEWAAISYSSMEYYFDIKKNEVMPLS